MNRQQRPLLTLLPVAVILGTFSICVHVIRAERQLQVIPWTLPRQAPADWAERLSIAIIGDSWVAGNKLDSYLAQALAGRGLNAEVVSSGQPGARSRQVAQNWFADRSSEYSLRWIWEDGAVDYVVVVVGVNDAAGHVGSERYCYHVVQLLKAIERNGMHAVLVELPEFGIEELPRHSLASTLKRKLFREFFDDGVTNVVSRYRDDLLNLISHKIEQGHLTFVDFDSVCPDYEICGDIYRDPAHLNEIGSRQLADTIADSIASTHARRIGSNVDGSTELSLPTGCIR